MPWRAICSLAPASPQPRPGIERGDDEGVRHGQRGDERQVNADEWLPAPSSIQLDNRLQSRQQDERA